MLNVEALIKSQDTSIDTNIKWLGDFSLQFSG